MANHGKLVNGWRWPLWGMGAGILGYAGHLLTMPDVTEAQRATGAGVIAELERGPYHVGVVAGVFAVFCLLVFAAGWRRWASAHAPASLAADVVSLAIVASAGAMIVGYGVKGMLALYLPGGINENTFPAEGLLTLYMIDDLGPFISWHGVAMAAVAVTWVSLRERVLPIWIGVVSLVSVLPPLALLVLTGHSGFPGVISPLWMVVIGIGLALRLRRVPVSVGNETYATAGA
ncbi:hypothetical protein BH23CHL2_BH23CHL2_34520 [soil metagenome]